MWPMGLLYNMQPGFIQLRTRKGDKTVNVYILNLYDHFDPPIPRVICAKSRFLKMIKILLF